MSKIFKRTKTYSAFLLAFTFLGAIPAVWQVHATFAQNAKSPPAAARQLNQSEPVHPEKRKLLGNWRLVGFTETDEAPNPLMSDRKVVIDATHFTHHWQLAETIGGPPTKRQTLKMSWKINPATEPKSIDLFGKERLFGIYKIAGNRLIIRYSRQSRPARFTNPHAGATTMVLLRETTPAAADPNLLDPNRKQPEAKPVIPNGEWLQVSFEDERGNRWGSNHRRFVFKGDSFRVFKGNSLVFYSTIRWQPATNTFTVVMPGFSSSRSGIYRMEGDTLKLCY